MNLNSTYDKLKSWTERGIESTSERKRRPSRRNSDKKVTEVLLAESFAVLVLHL